MSTVPQWLRTIASTGEPDYEKVLNRVIKKDTNRSVVQKYARTYYTTTLNAGSSTSSFLFQNTSQGTDVDEIVGDQATIEKLRMAFQSKIIGHTNNPTLDSAASSLLAVFITQSSTPVTPGNLLQTPFNIRSPLAYKYRDIVKVLFYKRYLINTQNIYELPVGAAHNRGTYGAFDVVNLYKDSFGPVVVEDVAAPNAITDGFVYVYFFNQYGPVNIECNFSCVMFDS